MIVPLIYVSINLPDAIPAMILETRMRKNRTSSSAEIYDAVAYKTFPRKNANAEIMPIF